MTTQHTPGPWSLDEKYSEIIKGARLIASVPVSTETDINEQNEANRLLIKAAPDMLEALKKARKAIEQADIMMSWALQSLANCPDKDGLKAFCDAQLNLPVSSISTAIAKAEGVQQ